MQEITIFWFRRDLRLNNNTALFHALKSGNPVIPIFIFDIHILNKLEDRHDRRVGFIHAAIVEIQKTLVQINSSLEVYFGNPPEVFADLLTRYKILKVFCNNDYEPYAIERDKEVAELLKNNGAALYGFKDHVVFEKKEVLKDDGKPYTIFTPYSKKWINKLTDHHLQHYPSEKYINLFCKQDQKQIPLLSSMGFKTVDQPFPSKILNEQIVMEYSKKRDLPGLNGTSKMGVHLRFGTVSIREIAVKAKALNKTYLNELIWRDFYHMILWHFPDTGKAFKPKYDTIEWRRDEGEFDKWCMGQTGYPIVDAGMRELNTTGFMHNRVRMITASFLTRHLLLDWRLGEAYFAQKLLDFDLAANNGGWQWAAGSGCDAAPYFRIFNPYLQTKKFDPTLEYIKKWVPEFQEFNYPQPIVDHVMARDRCLEVYGRALKNSKL